MRDFVKYLLEISKAGARKLSEKFAWVERALEEHLSETELRQGKYTVKQIEKMEKEFRRWLCEMPIIGFISAAYDLKLCRKYIFQALLEIGENLDYVIKRGGCYKSIKTTHMKFLDVVNFLAPGYSYDSFLVAYKAKIRKGYFPFEFFQDADQLKLDQTQTVLRKDYHISN